MPDSTKHRVYNFSAGPGALPLPVLKEMAEGLVDYQGLGRGIVEISHRSDAYLEIQAEAESNLRLLHDIPENHRVLFLHGGARFQFAMIPLNFLNPGKKGAYVVTGQWGKKAALQARQLDQGYLAFDGEAGGFSDLPDATEITVRPNTEYLHYTSNETVQGVEFSGPPDAGEVPLICDASSNIVSRPLDVSRHSLIYAGAQKNLGIAGVTLVVIRDDFLEKARGDIPEMLSFSAHVKADSRLNTPSVMAVYSVALTTRWLLATFGDLKQVAAFNQEKADWVYGAIRKSGGFFRVHAAQRAQSRMNVTFFTPSKALDSLFCTEAEAAGLVALKGYRAMGGMRASLYNAVPLEAARALAEFMTAFVSRHG